jgi:hypothetical protein
MIQKEYDDEKKHVHVISYGAGTQSTAMLLKSLKGEINGVIPDYIIFADTGWEPKHIYEWLNKVNEHIKKKYNREIHIASNGSLFEDAMRGRHTGSRFASMPFFTVHSEGKKGMVRRQCTNEYKITPVNKKIRELLGYKPRQRVKEMVHMWKGISTDEIQRVKPSKERWITAEHPLVDLVDMDRTDCIKYVENEGIGTPPKSACIGCPFRDNKSWLEIIQKDPEGFEQAIVLDDAIRHSMSYGEAFLHASRIPLKDVKFHEQTELDLFTNECEGMCGI